MTALAVLLLVAAAAGAGWWAGSRRFDDLRVEAARLRQTQRRLDEVDQEARRIGRESPQTPAERTLALESALASAAAQLGASRAVLWDVEVANNRLTPRNAAPGPVGRPVSLAGTPLRWVWEEKMPLRLESKTGGSGWLAAAGGACAVPIHEDSVLVFEFEQGRLPDDVVAASDAGRYVAALLDLQRAQQGADTARSRFDELLSVLERLTRAHRMEDWAAELAAIAGTLIGGTGAIVVGWSGTDGRVVSAAGGDGGPAAGMSVDVGGSEIGLAARSAAPIIRPEVTTRTPLAAANERWYARPRALAVLPLETADGVLGLVAAWNADRTGFDDAGLAALRTLAPYAALQLRQMVMQDTLRERAEKDALTGLPNRGAFNEKFDDVVKQYRRYRHPLSLILLDVDHFKRVNDTHGHEAGDIVLKQVGRILDSSVRETDFAARIGGEEFALLLPETDLPQAVDTAERIRVAVEQAAFDYPGGTLAIRVSAGVASCPRVVADPAGLLTSADGALYASKQGGRNRVSAARPSGPSSMGEPKWR